MKRYASLFLLPLLLMACQDGPPPDVDAAPDAYDHFGEAFEAEGAVPVQAVVAEPEQYVGQAVKIEGRVSEVCQAAGCWLTLQTMDGQNVRILVPRQENGSYVYTVPKDLSGRYAVVYGTLDAATVSEHAQHHYAADADPDADHAEQHGSHDEASENTETNAAPRPELHLTATGVLVEKATS